MNLYEAIVPAIIANVAVIGSFFDGTMISAKVKDEIGVESEGAAKSSPITERQRGRVEEMCRGVSSLSGFLANMAVVLATSIFALDFVPQKYQKFALGFLAITIVVSLVVIVQAAVMRLSNIDEKLLFQVIIKGHKISITPAVLMKLVLIIMNCLVFLEMSSGISVGPKTSGGI
jgi:hypothetical protein